MTYETVLYDPDGTAMSYDLYTLLGENAEAFDLGEWDVAYLFPHDDLVFYATNVTKAGITPQISFELVVPGAVSGVGTAGLR